MASQSRVFPGTDTDTGRAVALKKSRCSLIINNPHLRHEARILQLLQSPGHPAIPIIFGYVHLPHFEYIAMELLGPSVAKMQPDGTMIALKTVVSVVLQTVSVHSDLLCCVIFYLILLFFLPCERGRYRHLNMSTRWGSCTAMLNRET